MKIKKIFNLSGAVLLLLFFVENKAKAQPHFSFKAGLGLGKIQFYQNFHPIFVSRPGNEDIKYSPAWTFSAISTWEIDKNIDFLLSLSHVTLTADRDALLPNWSGFHEENFNQGFIHIIPAISFKGNKDRYYINSGIRFGTANPFGEARAKQASNSFWNTDIGLSNEFQFRINKSLLIGIEWIEGLTYYNYNETVLPGSGEPFYTFFKYRSFQLICEYEIDTN